MQAVKVFEPSVRRAGLDLCLDAKLILRNNCPNPPNFVKERQQSFKSPASGRIGPLFEFLSNATGAPLSSSSLRRLLSFFISF